MRDFVLENVESITRRDASVHAAWRQRLDMYRSLLTVGDEPSWKAIRKALVSDPITETREQLLYALRHHPGSLAHVIDAVVAMAEGTEAKPIGTASTAPPPSDRPSGCWVACG